MPSFGDSIFIFVLALILFGPKKLPEIARWVGKLMAEFRRASNEFRIQMEDELRIAEQAETQKKLAALAAPAVAEGAEAVTAETATTETANTAAENNIYDGGTEAAAYHGTYDDGTLMGEGYLENVHYGESIVEEPAETTGAEIAPEGTAAIATEGDLTIHPPATGLPTPAEKTTHD